MADRDNTESLLVRRKLTRALADAVRKRLSEHLATLAPLFRPQVVLGDYVVGGVKEFTRRAEQALKEVQAQYDAIAPLKPFNLRRELTVPFDVSGIGLEITPVDYIHVAQSGSETRRIRIRCPLVWTLSYPGFAPTRLPELLDLKVRGEDLQRFILSHVILQVVTTHQRGVVDILEAVHFPVTTIKVPEYGELPITRIGVGISTERPADSVVIETAELTGVDAFEEVVRVEDLAHIRDPFREQLLTIARQYAPADAF